MQRASGIPCALWIWGRTNFNQDSGAMRRENAATYSAVIARESGRSSTPRPIDSKTIVSGILGHPPARVMTTECVFAFSRRIAPEVCMNLSLKREGAGNAGCALHPRSRVRIVQTKLHTSIQGSGGTPTFPAQWLYGLYRDLPGERLFCLRCALGSRMPPGA